MMKWCVCFSMWQMSPGLIWYCQFEVIEESLDGVMFKRPGTQVTSRSVLPGGTNGVNLSRWRKTQAQNTPHQCNLFDVPAVPPISMRAPRSISPR